MDKIRKIFICRECLNRRGTGPGCDHANLIECEVGRSGDIRRQPIKNEFGRLVSRAPRWYLEAKGWVEPNDT